MLDLQQAKQQTIGWKREKSLADRFEGANATRGEEGQNG